jgi:hypothetical protein
LTLSLLRAFPRSRAFAEVAASYEQLDSERWPVCGQHHVGLHADVRDDRAVWWCRVGDHLAPESANSDRRPDAITVLCIDTLDEDGDNEP